MIKQRNIIDFAPNRRSVPTESITLPQLVVSAQRIAQHHLKELLPQFFAHIDDSLFDLADKAENNQQQTLYFDAMREARLRKNDMSQAYFAALETGFRESLTQTARNPPQSTGSLDQAGLMEDEQLEESLAITSMASNAENQFREALSGITARLNFLLETIEITQNNNPLRPEVLCGAFTRALECMDADIRVRLVIYKLFDKQVTQQLGALYDAINADLIAAGVLPRIKSTIRKSEDGGHPGTANSHYPADAEMQAVSGMVSPVIDPNQPESLFNSLQQLLSLQRSGPAIASMPLEVGNGHNTSTIGVVPSHAEAGVASFAPQDVVSVLSQLQINTDLPQQQDSDQPSAAVLKATVVKKLGQLRDDSESKQIDQADTDAIDIISMLFDFILDDPSLPDSLKAQIARLQIPMLKVAILDKEFFTKKAHPARQLLNELAYAGSGLDDTETEDDATFQMVGQVVERILTEFGENTEIFAGLLQEFTHFIEQEQEANKLAEELLEQVKERIAQEIEHRITDNRVPPLVRAILIVAWKDVLIHLHLRDGEQSTAWNAALQVVDDLIWSVQPKLVVSERQHLIRIIPRVLNGLRDGLTLINFDPEASERLFAGLEALHLTSLRAGLSAATAPRTGRPASDRTTDTSSVEDDFGIDTPTLSTTTDTVTAAGNDFMEEIILASTQPMPRDDDSVTASQYAGTIKDMALGTWVEFTNPETERRSCGKLAWKCDFTGEYTFVDRKYKVVADLTYHKLIETFEQGRAAIIDDVPLFDRALDSVINGIKHALDKGKSAQPV